MAELRQLTLGERAALELLEAARDAGESVPRAELEQAIGARYLGSLGRFAKQLALRGLAPGCGENGNWSIGHPTVDVERVDGAGDAKSRGPVASPISVDSLSADAHPSAQGASHDGRPHAVCSSDGASAGAPHLSRLSTQKSNTTTLANDHGRLFEPPAKPTGHHEQEAA